MKRHVSGVALVGLTVLGLGEFRHHDDLQEVVGIIRHQPALPVQPHTHQEAPAGQEAPGSVSGISVSATAAAPIAFGLPWLR